MADEPQNKLANVTAAPASTAVGAVAGAGIAFIPIPPTGDPKLDAYIAIGRYVVAALVFVIGALKGPKQ